jgi:predicted ATPase
MDFKINNVGVIVNSEIKIDGLTVITGDNNSGKSTVGKTICSIINSTLNLYDKNLREIIYHSITRVDDALDVLGLEVFINLSKSSLNHKINLELINDRAYFMRFQSCSDLDSVKSLILEIIDEIELINYEFVINLSAGYRRLLKEEGFEKNKQKSIRILSELIEKLDNDFNLEKYSLNKILTSLSDEFHDQIQPVRNPDSTTEISLSTENELYYDIKIADNKINKNAFVKNPFKNTYLISDVNILDKIGDFSRQSRLYMNRMFRRSLLLESTNDDLNYNLLLDLTSKITTYDMQTFAEKYSSLTNTINGAFSDRIILIDDKYVCDNGKLDIRNLATGSKMFAILKILIEKGKIGDTTLLVLDEPENHLHPKWQDLLAKVIVEIVKLFETKFIITTHSPNFLLALYTYSKLNALDNITNFYYAEKQDDNYSVIIRNENSNMEKVQYELNKPFIDISNLFESIEEESYEQHN